VLNLTVLMLQCAGLVILDDKRVLQCLWISSTMIFKLIVILTNPFKSRVTFVGHLITQCALCMLVMMVTAIQVNEEVEREWFSEKYKEKSLGEMMVYILLAMVMMNLGL
jgi:hypothetical protein